MPILIAGAIKLPQEDLVKLITADLFTCGIASIIQAIGLAHGGGAPSLLYVYKAFALIKIANYRFDDLVADANPISAARFSRLNELQ